MLNSSTLMNELTLNGRRGSRKRRRLSERRRAFTRIGLGDSTTTSTTTSTTFNDDSTRRDSGLYSMSSSTLAAARKPQQVSKAGHGRTRAPTERSIDSYQELNSSTGSLWPGGGGGGGDRGKISMKIQFHIKVAPDNEPLILDNSQMFDGGSVMAAASSSSLLSQPPTQASPTASKTSATTTTTATTTPTTDCGKRQTTLRKQSTTDSTTAISDHINERLSRQNTLNASRRRQQLVALHNQHQQHPRQRVSSCGGLLEGQESPAIVGAARSSTITGGMQDEATLRFLARYKMAPDDCSSGVQSSSSSTSLLLAGGGQPIATTPLGRRQPLAPTPTQDKIYFKRDGQRFGHEFTLKLAVDKNYRCLLKVRPLIPLQAISIQGHHVSFVDCSTSPSMSSLLQQSGANLTTTTTTTNSNITNSSSAPTSSMSLNSSWQSIDTPPPTHANPMLMNSTTGNRYNQHYRHRLCHAQTTTVTSPLASNRHQQQLVSPINDPTMTTTTTTNSNSNSSHSLNSTTSRLLQQQLLKQQQHQQMKRHFAASHCSPSGNPHLGSQLIYMFDWSAGRFEVNKNKDRTQLQTVLKFKNGEILALPLQVKFYQPESRQHLEWGSQLHFIDYDCNINNMGQISVDRIQYY